MPMCMRSTTVVNIQQLASYTISLPPASTRQTTPVRQPDTHNMSTDTSQYVFAAVQLSTDGSACDPPSFIITSRAACALIDAYDMVVPEVPIVMLLVGTADRFAQAVRERLVVPDDMCDDIVHVTPGMTEQALSAIFTEGGVYALSEAIEGDDCERVELIELTYGPTHHGVCATFGMMFSKEFEKGGLQEYTDVAYTLHDRIKRLGESAKSRLEQIEYLRWKTIPLIGQ